MTALLLKNTLELVHQGHIIDFNIADTTIEGKRIFQMGDVPRSKMPQLKGFPRLDSVAALLTADHNGKVDVAEQFVSYLTSHVGLKIENTWAYASALKGSQSELVASKVAKHALKMLANPDMKHKKFRAVYLVSSDYTLVDGHHGWAAVRCLEEATDQNIKLDVARVMCDTQTLLEHAHRFVSVVGIENKEGI
jgi:hypothetical protein